jgi:biotin synthase-like enzyme
MKTSKTTAAWNRYHRASDKACALREKASTLSLAAIDATDATVRAALMREAAKLRKAWERANVAVEAALSAANAACYR